MPFLTEELWQKLPGISNELHNAAYRSADATIMLADFPKGDKNLIDERAESEMQTVIELITKVRNIRAEMNIKPSDKPEIFVSADAKMQKIFSENEAQILKLARVSSLNLSETLDVPKASARGVLAGNVEIAIPLEGLIDFDKERERLENQLNKLSTGKRAFGKSTQKQKFRRTRSGGKSSGNPRPRGGNRNANERIKSKSGGFEMK